MENIIHNSHLLLANITNTQLSIYAIVTFLLVLVVAKSIASSEKQANHDGSTRHDFQDVDNDKRFTIIINNNPPNNQKKGNTFEMIFALIVIGAGFLLATGREEIVFGALEIFILFVKQALDVIT